MKNSPIVFAAICILVLSGCGSYKYNLSSVAGVNTEDLTAEKTPEAEISTELDPGEAFDKVLEIAENNNLTVYQENREKKLIVLMGFKEQIDTTRVGVFLSTDDHGTTVVTLNSLSTGALQKARDILSPEIGSNSP